MTDFEHILPLWRELESAGADYVLATVVEVQGSSYRRPGARMLLSADGRRAGTVSGGCLEAEVAKKAWWLTERGPLVERYSTLEDDGDLPYGSGCGGVIFILLERRATARPQLEALYAAWSAREPLAIATVLEGPKIGERMFAGAEMAADAPTFAAPQLAPWQVELQQLAYAAFDERKPRDEHITMNGLNTRVWVDYRPARPGLWIFGAGDDTKPLHKMARELGWFVAVADGRVHLATPERFPAADAVIPLTISDLPHIVPSALDVHTGDAAVLATHSYEQDTHILASLFRRAPQQRPAYIGILGPQRRTREALADAARLLRLTPKTELVDDWLEEINGPTGLDLGADTPASIALSILAEIQKSLTAATALPLKQVRAIRLPAEAREG
ncbi:MAG TPA: XdhC family protein [Terracidiphilus sp.]|jgi:xanthine/CO dehydrogenase XdhC/CoxF family maturation factor